MLYQVAITPDAKIIVQEFDIQPRKLTDEEFTGYSARSSQAIERDREYYIVPDKVTFGSHIANQLLSPKMAQDSPPPVAVVKPPFCNTETDLFHIAWRESGENIPLLKLHVAEYFFKSMLALTDSLNGEKDVVGGLLMAMKINLRCNRLRQLIESDEEMMALVKQMEG